LVPAGSAAVRKFADPHQSELQLPPAPPSVVPYGHEDGVARAPAPARPLQPLIVVPMVDSGAAGAGVIELVRILASAGHRPIVVTQGGSRTDELAAHGAEWFPMRVASINPLVMLANVPRMARLIRTRQCDLVHAHGRAAAWSAYIAARVMRRPLVTTWYKGFREQNLFKRLYNGIMARGARVIVVSDQIADLLGERYGLPLSRIDVIPPSVDLDRFDVGAVSASRVEAVRQSWGAGPQTKVMLVVGRMSRRKGHHVVVDAVGRLKALGLKDFLCVFASEGGVRTHYAAALWDRVLATGAADFVRLAGRIDDLPAAYAASSVIVSAAVQAEGVQRATLEAQAMARPVIVSDLSAGADVVLAPPAVSEDRMTGMRFPAGDASALAAAVVRLFSIPEAARVAIGARGRVWASTNFNAEAIRAQTLALYETVGRAKPGA
jgi:glycosyltransferase involved in cell wall biosynthesis